MLAAWVDFVLMRYARWRAGSVSIASGMTWLDTPTGRIRVFDSRSDGPCILFTPDGPNVIEHHLATLAVLSSDFRVVCFDMPGFGLSLPSASYAHSLDEGARVVLGVLDALGISRATLAFSCANGFYALRAAKLAPDRISSLFLAQTPSLSDMHAWAHRTVPSVLRIPVVGQFIGWLVRHRAARSWYRKALPVDADTEPFRRIAKHALACGGCFSLAGVVQALVRESDATLVGVTVPCTLLWGGADRSHRDTQINSLLTLVPHARILRVDDCGHFPDIEQPERYVHMLREHLTELR
jgi:pimeloyl-ACP methyl ester carboxylesterase